MYNKGQAKIAAVVESDALNESRRLWSGTPGTKDCTTRRRITTVLPKRHIPNQGKRT
jgi:hypothetical protein